MHEGAGTGTVRPQPLSGLVILEVAGSVAPAVACSLLADYGATVYIIETLPHGSPVRRLAPPAAADSWWNSIARGKQSIGIRADGDAMDPQLGELLRNTDAIVTDVPADEISSHPFLSRLSRLERQPVVLDLCASGAEQGQWQRPFSGVFAAALSGMAALTGPAGGAPVLPEMPLADSLAGAMGATALMAELAAQRRTGRKPRDLSVATHEAVQRMIEWQLPVATLRGRAEERCGNNFPLNAGISNMHKTSDGKYVAISAANQAVAGRLLHLVGGSTLADDERFRSPAVRAVNMPAIYEVIDAWVSARTQQEVIDAGTAADVVIGPVYDIPDILEDPHLRARGNLSSIASADSGARPAVNVVPRCFAQRGPLRPAPTLGRHTGSGTQEDCQS